jgi:hypothetical protein
MHLRLGNILSDVDAVDYQRALKPKSVKAEACVGVVLRRRRQVTTGSPPTMQLPACDRRFTNNGVTMEVSGWDQLVRLWELIVLVCKFLWNLIRLLGGG